MEIKVVKETFYYIILGGLFVMHYMIFSYFNYYVYNNQDS